MSDPFFGTARVIPVVSDVDRQRLLGVAYASEKGDLVITIKNNKFRDEVGAMFEITNAVEFMLGCVYVPAEKYQDANTTAMKVRKYFIDFSNNPRVVVSDKGHKDDLRRGRVYEISADGKIRVCFESGPGSVVEWFERHQLETIRDDVDVKIVPKLEVTE